MRARASVLLAALTRALSACEPAERADGLRDAGGERAAAAVEDAPAGGDGAASVDEDAGGGDPAAASDPDLERGELLSFACQACHSLTAGADHRVGPNLHRVFGRRAAAAPGYDYSDALRATDLVWTPEALDAWLSDPAGFVPGTTMTFTGYQSGRDRRDLIAFLVAATGP